MAGVRLWLGMVVVGVVGAAAEASHAPAGVDFARERDRARQYAEVYARLSSGVRPEERPAAEEGERAEPEPIVTLQPHFATTHPWVQRPVAHAGWYVSPAHPDVFFVRRQPWLVRGPIVIQRRVVVPRRYWLYPPFPPRQWW